MYFCYIDESGTSSIPGNTSHFILAGISIPAWHWKDCEREIQKIQKRYSLEEVEIHTGWILRDYQEQRNIPNFDSLNYHQRTSQVQSARNQILYRLQRTPNNKQYKQTKKNFNRTAAYIHLTRRERTKFIKDLARVVSKWGFARLFAECVDKVHFDPGRTADSIDKQTFEQIVSRFEVYLNNMSNHSQADGQKLGVLIHDNNATIAKKHTDLMLNFQKRGTLWRSITHIIETPLFVDSQLTRMVQIADLCSYALRRYFENQEDELFDLVFQRADRKDDKVVGIRHFSDSACTCKVCRAH